jgi:hypothetical protein
MVFNEKLFRRAVLQYAAGVLEIREKAAFVSLVLMNAAFLL